MPFVVTANCIVCKDLESNEERPASVAPAPAAGRTAEPAPRVPEHVRRSGAASDPSAADSEDAGATASDPSERPGDY